MDWSFPMTLKKDKIILKTLILDFHFQLADYLEILKWHTTLVSYGFNSWAIEVKKHMENLVIGIVQGKVLIINYLNYLTIFLNLIAMYLPDYS